MAESEILIADSTESPGSFQLSDFSTGSSSTVYDDKWEEILNIKNQENETMVRERLMQLKQSLPSIFTAFIKNIIQIEVTHGQIEQQTTDVIVNSADKHLKLRPTFFARKTVTYAITRKMGSVAIEHLRKDYPAGIRTGGVAIGGGGDLQCKNVFHVVLKPFSESKQEARLEKLQKAVSMCLSEAEKMKHTSIAFPAIGAGSHAYPAHLVAQTMLECIISYARHQTHSTIRKIKIFTGRTVGGLVEKAFNEQIQKLKVNHMFDADNQGPICREPCWLSYSYLHITTHTREELNKVIKGLS